MLSTVYYHTFKKCLVYSPEQHAILLCLVKPLWRFNWEAVKITVPSQGAVNVTHQSFQLQTRREMLSALLCGKNQFHGSSMIFGAKLYFVSVLYVTWKSVITCMCSTASWNGRKLQLARTNNILNTEQSALSGNVSFRLE